MNSFESCVDADNSASHSVGAGAAGEDNPPDEIWSLWEPFPDRMTLHSDSFLIELVT